MLEVNHISVLYDRSIIALQGIEFKVEKASIAALLGPNGAGKSTLMKAVTGMLPFEQGDVVEGSIRFEGANLDRAHPAIIARRGIAFVQDGRQCFRNLTIHENLKAASLLRPWQSKERLDLVFSYFPVLKEMHERHAGFLSGGQLQMLVIAMALMGNPKLLLLDEPSLGLSPVMVRAVFDVVERMHKELGMTVVVAEQTVPRLLKIAVDLYVLSRGHVVMHAAQHDVDEAALQRVYLS
jgi:branched-chain amino acid transport system ATP-binding protein